MEDAQKQLVDKLKSANNILVTVSRDPSVDQLAALIGLTLLLTKDDKHAAAVFSGKVPSTIEFLKPEETIESNTDSLRDFIIALDKNKADKLRYKVEDNVVRIFITPYKTSITQDDFEFSQGDFNVDLVIALGVQQQEDLDEAIVAHGQILHNATVASINVSSEGGLGTINWHQPDASSLSELVARLGQAIDAKLFDEQISTALMTGIVAETDRFSNEKTSPDTMSVSASLMSTGANQQLVASELMDAGQLATIKVQEDSSGTQNQAADNSQPAAAPVSSDGALEIEHGVELPVPENTPVEAAVPLPTEPPTFELPKPSIDNLPSETGPSYPSEGTMPDQPAAESGTVMTPGARLMTEPPILAPPPELTPYTGKEDEGSNAYGLPAAEEPKLLQHDMPAAAPPPPALSIPDTGPAASPSYSPPIQVTNTSDATSAPPLPPADTPLLVPDPTQPTDEVRTHNTLTQLEEAVASPHLKDTGQSTSSLPTAGLDSARSEVTNALNDLNVTEPPKPAESINAVQLGQELHPSDLPSDPSLPAAPAADPDAPPPVPPPIPFQFGNPPPQQ